MESTFSPNKNAKVNMPKQPGDNRVCTVCVSLKCFPLPTKRHFKFRTNKMENEED